jgi:hypothetical protein
LYSSLMSFTICPKTRSAFFFEKTTRTRLRNLQRGARSSPENALCTDPLAAI